MMRRAAAAATLFSVLALPGEKSGHRADPIVFTDAAQRAGIDFVLDNGATDRKHQVETMPAGIAVLDFDNDGFDDLYFVNGATVPKLEKAGDRYLNRLYRNNGDGTFTDVTAKAGVSGAGYSMAAAAGDYDNDGWTDVFVAGVNRNILYRNNRDGTFTDVTVGSGVDDSGPAKPWSISAGWFDYDNDGNLDLFVVNYCKWNPASEPYCGLSKPGYRTYCHPRYYGGLPNALYRNNGDGTFTDVSASSGIGRHIGKGMGVAFADYDDDGFQDVFVANDTEPDFLFHNEGGGRFTETALLSGVGLNPGGLAISSMGADFRDIDNDGRPDLFVSALSNETFPLLINLGGGAFRDVTYQSRLGFLSLASGGFSAGVFDLNNDGWKDIFVAGSHVMDNEELYSSRSSRQPNHVFTNLGDGKFGEATDAANVAAWPPRFHRGTAFGDFDHDGRIDVAVSCLNERAELLLNRSAPGNHWLQVKLEGRQSNRDAIGAKLRLMDDAGYVQYNHVTTAVGYACSSTKTVHFGLGKAERVKQLEIRWPSGKKQVLKDIVADQHLKVVEPD